MTETKNRKPSFMTLASVHDIAAQCTFYCTLWVTWLKLYLIIRKRKESFSKSLFTECQFCQQDTNYQTARFTHFPFSDNIISIYLFIVPTYTTRDNKVGNYLIWKYYISVISSDRSWKDGHAKFQLWNFKMKLRF